MRVLASILFLMSLLAAGTAAGQSYDPLSVAGNGAAPLDLAFRDGARDREVPLRIYLPVATAAAPVVLFSHGLGGSRRGSAFMGEHWAARGLVAVYLQHPGSDEHIWRNVPGPERLAALARGANVVQALARVQDVSAVIDQLERWNGESGHPLAGRVDLNRIGMSGHSFGARTTQAVSGMKLPDAPVTLEPRIRAALILSPSGAPDASQTPAAFAGVSIPWMLMTGTHDLFPLGNADMRSRLSVYPALPAGNKYELVLDRAEHSVFTERALPGDSLPRNPNHHRAIRALSTAFWEAHLLGDVNAQRWLNSEKPRETLESADRWQFK